MPKANRICKTCGKQYFFCNNCERKLNSPQWMLMWDTENCKSIFEIVSNYAQKVDSKAVAKKKLSKCDLSQQYSFTENIRVLIEEIMHEDKDKVEEPKENVEASRKTIRHNEDEETSEDVPKKKSGLLSADEVTEDN